MKTFLDKVEKLHFDPVLTPFCPKSQEPEFCQTWGFHQKKRIIDLYQHVQYLKKQMKTFRENSKRALFDPVLTTFCPKSREPDFSWTPNLAHTWRTIRAPFWQKKPQNGLEVFKKPSKEPFRGHKWPRIWRTRFFLASILYTHIEYHKSPILTEN